MTDTKIGTRNPDGSIATFPTLTLSGAPYNREAEVTLGKSLPGMVLLDGNRFVVLDLFPPKDFDRNAAIEELRGTKPVQPTASTQPQQSQPINRRMTGESETTSS